MSEFRSFAGFWVDGAVRKPEERHTDLAKDVVARHKIDGGYEAMRFSCTYWDSVYWLDTTTPTELTPQQAFELCKVIYPGCSAIESTFGGDSVAVDENSGPACINWKGTTQYPPPKKWRVPTDADKNALCLCKRNSNDVPRERRFVSCFNGRFIVWNDETQASEQYDICEVLDE